MEILRDKYDELFIIVMYLLQEGSLTHTEIKEFIEIMESSYVSANIAILKAIQKSDMALDRKDQIKRELGR